MHMICIHVMLKVGLSGLQELMNLNKSFEDPKFIELLGDYLRDSQDPKVIGDDEIS